MTNASGAHVRARAKFANRAFTNPGYGRSVRELLMEHQQRLEIAARIRDLRERSPFRQQDVADRVGVELRTYQKWEQKGTGWENLEKLAEVYGTTAEAIWKGETPDLTATFNGSVPQELQAQLDSIEAKLDRLLS